MKLTESVFSLAHPENTKLRGSITVLLTSCLFCLDSAALPMLNLKQPKLFGQIQTSQTGVKPYSDTFLMVSVICLILVFWSLSSVLYFFPIFLTAILRQKAFPVFSFRRRRQPSQTKLSKLWQNFWNKKLEFKICRSPNCLDFAPKR